MLVYVDAKLIGLAGELEVIFGVNRIQNRGWHIAPTVRDDYDGTLTRARRSVTKTSQGFILRSLRQSSPEWAPVPSLWHRRQDLARLMQYY